MSIEESLAGVGVARHAAAALAVAASRAQGMIVFCGPAGVGKTTLAQLLVSAQRHGVMHWLGDLRLPDEIGEALAQAERESVVAVVRSGQSRGLRDRWSDMGLVATLVDRASVFTVTLRRLARAGTEHARSPSKMVDVLVLEILGPDGSAVTGSLADEARALVAAGVTTADEARFNVPDYV